MKNVHLTLFFIGVWFLISNNTFSQKAYQKHLYKVQKIEKIKDNFDRFGTLLTGIFKANVVTETAENTIETEMVMASVLVEEAKNERWLYVEYFLPSARDQPMSQQLWHLEQNGNMITIMEYPLKKAGDWVNAWDRVDPFQGQEAAKLADKDKGCPVVFEVSLTETPTFSSIEQDKKDLCDMSYGYGPMTHMSYSYKLSSTNLILAGTLYGENEIEISKLKGNYKRLEKGEVREVLGEAK